MTQAEDLKAFVKDMDDAEDEAELNGPVPPDMVRKRLDEAKARGRKQRALDQAASDDHRRIIGR